jgi:hypothetical protein
MRSAGFDAISAIASLMPAMDQPLPQADRPLTAIFEPMHIGQPAAQLDRLAIDEKAGRRSKVVYYTNDTVR